MLAHSLSFVIDAAAERVFSVVSDPGTLVELEPAVVSCRQRVGNGPGPGAIYRVELHSCGRTWGAEYKVTGWEWLEQVTLSPSDPRLPEICFELVERDGGVGLRACYSHKRRRGRLLDVSRAVGVRRLVEDPVQNRVPYA